MDDKLAAALAVAIAQNPRGNLQQLAKSAGISKATLYRKVSTTREGVIDLLMERANKHLQNAIHDARLNEPPFMEALQRLTTNVMQGRAFYQFWNVSQWVQMLDDKNLDEQAPIPSFYGEALEEFFLQGQKAGVFRIDLPAKWLVKAYDSLLYALLDAAQRGEVATVGMDKMIDKIFLTGILEVPNPDRLNHL